jgi:hypothetical protein
MAAGYRPRGPSPRSPTNPPVNRSSIADTSRRDRARSFGEWASYGGAFNQMERSPFPEPVALFYCSAFQSADPLFAWHSEMSVCRGSRKPQDVLRSFGPKWGKQSSKELGGVSPVPILRSRTVCKFTSTLLQHLAESRLPALPIVWISSLLQHLTRALAKSLDSRTQPMYLAAAAETYDDGVVCTDRKKQPARLFLRF